MKEKALAILSSYSSKSAVGKALSNFLENYEALTLFLESPELSINNNLQERLLMNPVVERKAWYGTHSKRGAETATIFFTLVRELQAQ